MKLLNGEIKAIKDFLYVPSLKRTLLSFGALTDKGFNIHFSNNECEIPDHQSIKTIFITRTSLLYHTAPKYTSPRQEPHMKFNMLD